MKIYKKHVDVGRYFLHEDPATAVSRHEKPVLNIPRLPDVQIVTADQCMYGLETKLDNGGTAPAMQPAKLILSGRDVADTQRQVSCSPAIDQRLMRSSSFLSQEIDSDLHQRYACNPGPT